MLAPLLDRASIRLTIATGPFVAGNRFAIASLGVNIMEVTVSYRFVATVPGMSSLTATISETGTG